MMEQLKSMKSNLIAQVQAQLANIEKADAHELGAAIDMIKDLSMVEYYHSIVKAMEEAEQEKKNGNGEVERYYYTEKYMPIEYQRYRDMDRGYGRMYYDDWSRYAGGDGASNGGMGSGGNGGGSRNYQERENPRDMGGRDRRGYDYYERAYDMPVRDSREGRSPSRRKMYMEGKEMHHEKEKQMQELESYMSELSSDITEMIHDASPEERQLLQKKLTSLATKIDLVK